MKYTSVRTGTGIKGVISDRPTGPNASDQPKPMNSGSRHNQKPSNGKITSEPPLSYSHKHKTAK